ncbi:hypothetical protein CEXT_639771 [Caerostris extrusa]|uniref:Uncharacterized protein n=1 Tax=Caerostris extrusa TaxID=172846 RepID=A0AAV4M9Q4_CAEEX|nr:hypothetical protein CEXT_639771 [Caerostris extrusa]
MTTISELAGDLQATVDLREHSRLLVVTFWQLYGSNFEDIKICANDRSQFKILLHYSLKYRVLILDVRSPVVKTVWWACWPVEQTTQSSPLGEVATSFPPPQQKDISANRITMPSPVIDMDVLFGIACRVSRHARMTRKSDRLSLEF